MLNAPAPVPLPRGTLCLTPGNCRIMGILNITPDSFSDGGAYLSPDNALRRAEFFLERGVNFLDIGAESTRPGAADVSADEEKRRLIPVLHALEKEFGSALIKSVDTRKSEVADCAGNEGADLINDVSGGWYDPRIFAVTASYKMAYIIMHSRIGVAPAVMQNNEHLHYADLFGEMDAFFRTQMQAACQSRLATESILLDPGIGFSKTFADNRYILENSDVLCSRFPNQAWVFGYSRKRFLEAETLTEKDAATQRITASLMARKTPLILRVHTV